MILLQKSKIKIIIFMDKRHKEDIDTERRLRVFLDRCIEERRTFSGKKSDSKDFVIIDRDETTISVRNVDKTEEDKPIILSFTLLLNGILSPSKYKYKKVKDYAKFFEKSKIVRSNSDSPDSVESKFYFSLHYAFLEEDTNK